MVKTLPATKIWQKLEDLEQDLQKIKVQLYLDLPSSGTDRSSLEKIIKAVRQTRRQIWQEKYEKKI